MARDCRQGALRGFAGDTTAEEGVPSYFLAGRTGIAIISPEALDGFPPIYRLATVPVGFTTAILAARNRMSLIKPGGTSFFLQPEQSGATHEDRHGPAPGRNPRFSCRLPW